MVFGKIPLYGAHRNRKVEKQDAMFRALDVIEEDEQTPRFDSGGSVEDGGSYQTDDLIAYALKLEAQHANAGNKEYAQAYRSAAMVIDKKHRPIVDGATFWHTVALELVKAEKSRDKKTSGKE